MTDQNNPYLFAQEIQSGKTLDDLFVDVHDRQLELINNVKEIASAFGGRVQLIIPAIKSRERAEEKLATVFRNSGDPAQLSDITRLTVVFESPDLAEEFKNRLKKYYADMCDTGWKITAALRLDRAIYVGKNGFISQIFCKGPEHAIVNEKCHKIFEVSRLMAGEGRKFDASNISDTMRKRIMAGYNNLAEQQDYAPYLSIKDSIADFSGDALYQRYLELIHAQQSIRLASVPKNSKQWQELYVPLILHANESAPPDRRLTDEQIMALPSIPSKLGDKHV